MGVKARKSSRICIVRFPTLKQWFTLSTFLDVIETICEECIIITGNVPEEHMKRKSKFYLVNVPEYNLRSLSSRFIRYIVVKLRILTKLISLYKEFDSVIFFVSFDAVPESILASKLLRKRVLLLAAGSPHKSFGTHAISRAGALSKIVRLIEHFSFSLAHYIVTLSKQSIEFQGLHNYAHKTKSANPFYVDLERYHIKIPFESREIRVGFMGRLENVKGILRFVEAARIVSRTTNNVSFTIIGDGSLYEQVKTIIDSDSRCGIELLGWIPYDEITDNLNRFRLLVIPSVSEGLPITATEAMACGTPVLATNVGGVPDLINDSENGFLFEYRNPSDLAKKIIEILKLETLNNISKQSRHRIEQEYSLAATITQWKSILLPENVERLD